MRAWAARSRGAAGARPSPLTFHKVNNDGQSIFWAAEGETTEKKDKRKQNTAYARVGILVCRVFRVFGVFRAYGV